MRAYSPHGMWDGDRSSDRLDAVRKSVFASPVTAGRYTPYTKPYRFGGRFPETGVVSHRRVEIRFVKVRTVRFGKRVFYLRAKRLDAGECVGLGGCTLIPGDRECIHWLP